MSVTPKEQFEDAIAENARLRRELDAAQAESAEARGNVEKALRELAEEVHKRQKAERQCAEMLNAISRDLPLLAKSLEHFNGYADWRNSLLQIHEAANKTDCGKDYVSRAVVAQLVEALEAMLAAAPHEGEGIQRITACQKARKALAEAKEVL